MLLSNFNFTVYMGFPLIKNPSRIFRLLVSHLCNPKNIFISKQGKKTTQIALEDFKSQPGSIPPFINSVALSRTSKS